MISSKQLECQKALSDSTSCRKKALAWHIGSIILTGFIGAPLAGAQTLENVSDSSVLEQESETVESGNTAVDEEVLVTGIRASQRGAIDLKRTAGTMADAIVAEDVSQFPDKNMAEALQRITGVQMTRDFGEGRGINIRGMAAGLNRTEVDGVSVLGTGGGRDIDFGDMASELVKVLTVVKGSEARITEGGIGGTIQLELRKPHDFDDNYLSMTMEQQYNDLSQDYSPKANFTGVYKFTDDVGVMLNLNASDKHTMIHALRNTQWNRWADYDMSAEKSVVDPLYADIESADECTSAYGPNGSNDVDALNACNAQWYDFAPETPRYGIWERQEKRISTNLAFGWDVNDSLNLFTDITYNERDKSALDRNLQLESGSFQRIDPASVVVDENHNVRAFTTSNASMSNRTLDFSWVQSSSQFKAGFDYSAGQWDWEGIVSRSKSKQDIDSRDTHITQNGVAGVRVELDEQGAPEFDLTTGYRYQDPYASDPDEFTAISVNDPASYNARARYKYAPVIQYQKEDSAKIDVVYNFDDSFLTKIRSGLRYASRSMEETNYQVNIIRDVGTEYGVLDSEGNAVLDDSGEAVTREWTIEDQTELVTGTMSASPYLFPSFDLGVRTIGSYQAVNTDPLIARLTAIDATTVDRNQLPARPGAYYIVEDSFAGYLQTDFETDLSSMRLWGNVGVRYVYTQVESEGDVQITTMTDQMVEDENGNMVPARDDNGNYLAPISTATFDGRDTSQGDYIDILPSVNLNLSVVPDVFNLYFGAAKVMARPDIHELNVNATCTIWETEASQLPGSNIYNTCTAGNPDLDPYRATQWDFAAMWYPNEDSLISAAIFQKKLTSFVGPVTTFYNKDFFEGGVNGGVLYDVRQKTNIEGVTTQGFEFQARTVFSMLPGFLSNVGGEFNYTKMDADDVPYESSLDGSALPLLEQSGDSYNLTGFYEDDSLTLRVAYNYRSEYLRSVSDRSGAPVFVDESGHLDAKVSYTFGDTGFQVYADGRNLISEVQMENAGEGRLSDLQWAGRTYSVGFTFKY